VLKTYMQDTLNARLMGVEVTAMAGASRSRTRRCRDDQYVHAGRDKDPDEIIASVQRGLYAKNFGGGQVDIVSGKFVFSASRLT
jgi:TldD protein